MVTFKVTKNKSRVGVPLTDCLPNSDAYLWDKRRTCDRFYIVME